MNDKIDRPQNITTTPPPTLNNNQKKDIIKFGNLNQELLFSLLSKRYVALKVQKSAEHYTEAAWDEIELLKQIAKQGDRYSNRNGGLSIPVVKLLGIYSYSNIFIPKY